MAQVTLIDDSEDVPGITALPSGQLPAALACDRYDYVHYPMGWQYNAKCGFIPALSQPPHTPGVNGVAAREGNDGAGRKLPPDATRLLAGCVGKGGTVISPTDNRLGKYRGFLRRSRCANGAWFYHFIGTKVAVWGPGDSQHSIEPSPDWVPFLAFLRDQGIVDPISEPAYRRLEEAQIQHVNDAARRYRINTNLKKEVDEAQQRLDAMRKEWAKILDAGRVSAVPKAPEAEAVA